LCWDSNYARSVHCGDVSVLRSYAYPDIEYMWHGQSEFSGKIVEVQRNWEFGEVNYIGKFEIHSGNVEDKIYVREFTEMSPIREVIFKGTHTETVTASLTEVSSINRKIEIFSGRKEYMLMEYDLGSELYLIRKRTRKVHSGLSDDYYRENRIHTTYF